MVKLNIGGQPIDSYSGDAMRVFANDTKTKVDIHGSRVFIPLNFFFQNNPQHFIPLVAMQYHDVVMYVILNGHSHQQKVSSIALMYKAIFVDTEERRYLTTASLERIIYTTVEQKYTNIIVDSNNCNATLGLDMRLFKHIVKDVFIHLKPHFLYEKKEDQEPLHKIELQYNKMATFEFDPILTRRIIPRELHGIDNQELIYYIPMDDSCNFSRIEYVDIKLAFAIKGTFDVHVLCKINNVMRIMAGMAGLAHA